MNDINDKLKKERIMMRLSTISLIVFAAVFFSLFVFLLIRTGVIVLPDNVARFFGMNTEEVKEVIPGDGGKIYEALRGGEVPEGSVVEYDISRSDAKEELSLGPTVNEYTAVFNYSYTDGNEKSQRIVKLWRSGDKYRINRYSENSLEETVICDGERISAIDAFTGKEVTVGTTGGFSIESLTGIPSSSDFLNNDSVTELAISILRTSLNNVYFVSYRSPERNTLENLYISVEYGIVTRAEIYRNDILNYTLICPSVEAGLTGYDGDIEDIFTVPPIS